MALYPFQSDHKLPYTPLPYYFFKSLCIKIRILHYLYFFIFYLLLKVIQIWLPSLSFYWIGQKGPSGFPVRCGKSQNFWPTQYLNYACWVQWQPSNYQRQQALYQFLSSWFLYLICLSNRFLSFIKTLPSPGFWQKWC